MQFSKHFDLCSVGFTTGASSLVEVDCAEAGGVVFIGVPCSTAARTWSLALSAGASTTGMVSCSSTHTLSSTAAGVDVLCTEVIRPAKRWIGATLSSTTATPCFLLGLRYNCHTLPTTWSATANLATGLCKTVYSPTSST